MRVAQVGNFEPDHSTENELRKALDLNGHVVHCYQENERNAFTHLAAEIDQYELVLWTRTGWQPPVPHSEQWAMLSAAEIAGVPTVGYHLDRWWGLHREHQVHDEPFFCCSLVVTADGGHQAEFAAAGVNHHWLPPGVSELECAPGIPRSEYQSDVAFVGSWRPGYHQEWTHRPQLVEHLRRRGCRFWPEKGQPAIRGKDLRDLYASTRILIGDSCLAGGATRYWSDRIPETLGRGGFLIHPYVEGIEEHFTDGKHLRLWEVGDWADLDDLIDYYLKHDRERTAIADEGRRHVLENHTYTVRMRQVEALL